VKGDKPNRAASSCKKHTMKTDKNSRTNTTSGTDTHPEQAIPDTNQEAIDNDYNVHIYRARFDEGNHTVRAESKAEALEKAIAIVAADLDDDRFFPIESVIQIVSVELDKEEQSHE
jgi:hypothetical protein